MPDQREQALSFLRLNGPSLPVQVAKALNTNILFASAVLSELSSKKQLKVSHAAIGGSKVYYLQGQERKLGEKLYPALKGKPKEAYELLRDKKVLRDRALEPWQRIAYRELKDFAYPLTVSFGDEAELFWKFHLLPDEEAKPYISGIMEPPQEIKKAEAEEIQEPPKEEPEPQEEPEVEEVEEEEEEIEEEDEPEELEEELEESDEEDEEEDDIEEEPEVEEKPQVDMKDMMRNLKEEILKELRPKLEKELRAEMKQETIIKPKPQKLDGKFYSRIKSYLESNMIEVLKEEMVKKDKEFDFIVRIPSAFGNLQYYLKAKDKKTINEADVTSAHSEGQLKRMPTIFLVTGKLGKKAATLVDQKFQGQLTIKEF